MAHLVNSPFQVKAQHAGLNTVVANYTLNETASSSTSIAIHGIPAGAQIVDIQVRANHAALNAGANAGAVRANVTIGGTVVGTLIPTSTIAYHVSMSRSGADLPYVGLRVTSSAVLQLNLHDCAGTGTASTQFTVITSYLAEKSGD